MFSQTEEIMENVTYRRCTFSRIMRNKENRKKSSPDLKVFRWCAAKLIVQSMTPSLCSFKVPYTLYESFGHIQYLHNIQINLLRIVCYEFLEEQCTRSLSSLRFISPFENQWNVAKGVIYDQIFRSRILRFEMTVCRPQRTMFQFFECPSSWNFLISDRPVRQRFEWNVMCGINKMRLWFHLQFKRIFL